MEKVKTKIWVVSDVYWPSQISSAHILKKIVQGLIDNHNREVGVITVENQTAYSEVKSLEPTISEETIYYAAKKSSRSGISRLYWSLLFLIKAALLLKQKASNKDEILVLTNPISLPLLPLLLTNKNVSILCHDLFPLNLIRNAGGYFKAFLVPVKTLYRTAYRRFKFVISLGDDMTEVLRNEMGVENVQKIPNWFDDDIVCSNTNKSQKINLLFAGNVGRFQGLEKFLNWFTLLERDLFNLRIIGSGEKLNDVKELVRLKKINNVVFEDSLPRAEQSRFLGSCDFGVVSLESKMFGLGVPSKSYNILAAGRPILYFGPRNTEIDILVRKNNLGVSIDIDTKEQSLNIDKNLFDFKQMRNYVERQNSRDQIIAEFNKLLR